MKLLMAQNEDGGKRKNAARRRELEAAQKRIGELNGIFKRLYEDSGAGALRTSVSWSCPPIMSRSRPR